MPFGPHKITDIDQAWENKLGTLVLTGSSETLTFFQEEPSVKTTTERTYPSITLMLIGILEDAPRREGAPDQIKVGENLVPDPPESDMQERPQPYRLLYSVDTWAKGRARDDRELVQHVLEKLGDRGILTNPTSGDLHNAFRVGFSNADEEDGDVRIYHKAFTYEVEVCIGPAEVVQVQQATEFSFGLYASPTHNEGPVEGDPDNRLALTFTVTE